MPHRRVTVSLVFFSVVVVTYFLHGFMNANGDTQPTNSTENSAAERRRRARARIDQLRSATRRAPQGESQRRKERLARFRAILETIIGDTNAIVVDTARLRNMHLARPISLCLEKTHGDDLERVKRELGIGILADTDQVAFARHFLLVDGSEVAPDNGNIFRNASKREYGTDGEVFVPEDTTRPSGGIWKRQLLVVSDDVDEIREAIDIAEAPYVTENPTNGFRQSSALIHGTMPPGKLMNLLGVTEYVRPIASLLDTVVRDVFFEIHVHHSVLLTTTLALHENRSKDLLLAGLEGLRTLLIQKSVFFDYADLAELIDTVVIRDDGNEIHLEMEMPFQFLERELTRCTG